MSAEESGPVNGGSWRADFPILRISERPSEVVEACSPQVVERVLHIVGLYDILTEDGHRPPSDDGNGQH